MLDPDVIPQLREVIQQRAAADRKILDDLRAEVRPLHSSVQRIRSRSTTAVSLVASDGGNNRLEFDPFLVQLVRVVDSYGKTFCLDAVSPTSNTNDLSSQQFNEDRSPKTPLGYLMADLGCSRLWELSPMIPKPPNPGDDTPISASWVLVYRDLCEWAVLYERICKCEFGSDTLIVRDGLLRSKVFRGDLFIQMRNRLKAAIDRAQREMRRRLYLVGIAKHSNVLTRYQLAMAIEGVMQTRHPCFLEVPLALEAKAYVWPEYARGTEDGGTGEAPKFKAGKMFLVKFGDRPRDPVWPVDILDFQSSEAPQILGYLLADSLDGFPVPFYPRCLQKAHENAALVGFDMDILQEEIFRAIRESLPDDRQDALESFRLSGDPSGLRYE